LAVCLALGAVGIFVPLLPTTPLVLLAAFAFANSSETLHQWLLDHSVFGPFYRQLAPSWRHQQAREGDGARLRGDIHPHPAVAAARLNSGTVYLSQQ